MKITNFSTYTGGFPFDAEVFKWDRDGLWEAIGGIFDGYGNPNLVISGVNGGGANGWVRLGGELMPYIAPGLPPALMVGYAYYFLINRVSTPAIFEDLTSHDVLEVNSYATLTVGLVSSPPPGAVLIDSVKRWEEVCLGPRSKTGWLTLWSASSGTITGNIFYQKDLIANTLQLKGTITVSASLFGSSELTTPLYRVFAGTLPVGFRPASIVPFQALRRYSGVPFLKDGAGIEYIHSINAEVQDTGYISFGFIKPDTGVASYTVSFNQVIPLG